MVTTAPPKTTVASSSNVPPKLSRVFEDESTKKPTLFGSLGLGKGLFEFFLTLIRGADDHDDVPDNQKTEKQLADNPPSTFNKIFENLLGFDDKQFKDWRKDLREHEWKGWEKTTNFAHAKLKDIGNFVTHPPKDLLDLVARRESNNNYDIVYGGKTTVNYNGRDTKLTQMTVDQVLEWQSHQHFSAAGRFQIVHDTLLGLKKQGVVRGDELFSEQTQDRAGTHLLQECGLDKWRAGQITEAKFTENISRVWASVPKDASGRSFYEGDGVNHALLNPSIVATALANDKANYLAQTNSPAAPGTTGQFNGAVTNVASNKTPTLFEKIHDRVMAAASTPV